MHCLWHDCVRLGRHVMIITHLSWEYCTGASLVHHVMSVSQSDGENEAEVVRKNVAGFIVM